MDEDKYLEEIYWFYCFRNEASQLSILNINRFTIFNTFKYTFLAFGRHISPEKFTEEFSKNEYNNTGSQRTHTNKSIGHIARKAHRHKKYCCPSTSGRVRSLDLQ